jgi:hypothetical protein
MSTMRYKPSKPVAIFSALVGAAMLVFGIVQFGRHVHPRGRRPTVTVTKTRFCHREGLA